MADDFLTPIINEFKTILVANLPGEIDDLDTSLADVPANFMFKAMKMARPQFPMIEIFPTGQSVVDPNYTNATIDFDWRIATIISLGAKDEPTGELNARKYMTAMIKSIEKGTGANTFKLNGVADFAGPIGVDFIGGGISGNILFAVLIMWEVRKKVDPLSGV